MSLPSESAAFRERYAIQRLRDGGVIVDLATGTYLRLNLSAAEICSVLLDSGETTSSISRVAECLKCGDALAERAIADVMAGLSRLGPRREPIGSYRYLPDADGGYILMSNDVPRISIESDGTFVRLASPDDVSTTYEQIFAYLRAVAPKALFLQAKVVMHGAASRTREGVRIISGCSGAGKTTTARAFAAAGADLVAEDMLVVASLSPFRVFTTGERAIDAWAERSADQLVHNRHGRIATSMLHPSNRGEPTTVAEVWFINGARRTHEMVDILPKRIGETDAALAVMTSLFLGSLSPDAWRGFLSVAGSVAATVPVFEALMPAGIDRLKAAAKRYTVNSAS